MRNRLAFLALFGLAGLVANASKVKKADSNFTFGTLNIEPMYPAFRVKDPYFDYGLSCYPCIQNNYIYCREGT